MSAAVLGLEPEQFAQVFPFHLAFDERGCLVQAGQVLQRIAPGLTVGQPVAPLVTIARPRVEFSLDAIRSRTHSLFILRLKEPAMTLRGQMVVNEKAGIAVFLGSPWLTRIDEISELGLSLSDFANHDGVAEFLLLFQTKDMALADAEALTERLQQQGNALQTANSRLETQEKQLRESNDALARVARLKDEFLSSMSHELRTPLNAVLGMSESLLEGVYGTLDERQRRAVSLVESSGRHLLELINDILDLSRIEAGRLELDCSPVQVAPLCLAAIAMVRPAATRKNVALSLAVDPAVTVVDADQRRMKQILVNLLSNAVKFTNDGGSVSLTVTGRAEAGEVRFAVRHTGIGIAEADFPRLFTPFVQLDSGLDRQHGGTGLGLVLTRRMAELHGGSIAVASQVGVGSTFTVILPWRTAGEMPDLPDTRLPAAEPVSPVNLGPHHRLLLVDDNESNRSVLADYLSARGFEVTVAGDALTGIEQARTLRPDLILMDVQMPGLDGFEATGIIRRDPVLARTPVFALTSLAMKGDRERCLAAGFDDYIAKPVRLQDLAAKIRDYLRTQAQEVSA